MLRLTLIEISTEGWLLETSRSKKVIKNDPISLDIIDISRLRYNHG